MRIVVVADLHGRLPEIPKCDVLAVAGDLCPDFGWDADIAQMRQTEWLGDEWSKWEQSVPAEHIIATLGNHDWVAAFPDNCRSRMYVDEGVTISGISFWFTPWVAPCGDWNYLADRDKRRYYFDNVPHKVDVLIMHGPAFGVGDLTYSNEPAGCREMRDVIQRRQPRFAFFGHIHEGQRYGKEYRLGGTKLFHTSMWGDNWKPTVIDIVPK
jgi:Icc-related predicted phosphoesterase